MGGRGQRTSQHSKLDKYAYNKDQQDQTEHTATGAESSVTTGQAEVMLQDIMAALTKVQTSICSVSTDISLLRADFQKMAVRMTDVETTTTTLSADMDTIKKQVR